MRSPARTIATAAALFSVVLTMQQCGGQSPAPDDSTAAGPTTRELMERTVIPSSQKVFDAVVYSNGQLTVSPRSEAEWLAVREGAQAVAEAAKRLGAPPLARGETWSRFAEALDIASTSAVSAATKQDIDGVLRAGSDMYDACSSCHEVYSPEVGS
jgi:cytochrome c556